MQKRYGFGVLAIGLMGLGWWAQGHNAVRIQEMVAAQAASAVQGSVHGVTLDVAGRDIALLGTVDGPEELQRLVTALEDLPGRRVVRADQAVVLPVVTPFEMTVEKVEGGALSAAGYVNTERTRAGLSSVLGASAAGLKLAAGAPAGWADLVTAGIAALAPMQSGKIELTDGKMVITGTVLGPQDAVAVDAALDTVPGESLTRDVVTLDDGTPASFEVTYTATSGGFVAGKLPKDLQVSDLSGALGLPDMTADVTQAYLGEAMDASALSGLKPWMAQIETLSILYGPDLRKVVAGVLPGVDTAALQTGIADVLGSGTDVSVVPVTPEGTNGQTRVIIASGEAQRFMGGFWVTVPQIEVGKAGCQTAVDGLLGSETITFVSGSDELDTSAVSVINRLAGIIARCAEEANLKAKIAGHTDNVGDVAANLGLSQRRATAVRKALIDRGVPGAALVAIGYGDTVPVADNATDEGRAKNRRTAIVWSD